MNIAMSGGKYNTATEAPLALVQNKRLPFRHKMRLEESYGGPFFNRRDKFLPVAVTGHARAVLNSAYPIFFRQFNFCLCRVARKLFGRDGNSIKFCILFYHILWRGARALNRKSKPVPLAERVGLYARVFAYNLAVFVEHVAGHERQFLLQHVVDRDVAEEAEPLAVLATGIRETEPPGKLAYLYLFETPNRKQRLLQFCFRHRPQKV